VVAYRVLDNQITDGGKVASLMRWLNFTSKSLIQHQGHSVLQGLCKLKKSNNLIRILILIELGKLLYRILAKESLGYYELKKHKSWFNERSTKFLYQGKQGNCSGYRIHAK
jgi:hypothetical protein